MKRGNTALKRVVSVASVAAMAIAGAVLAAPAASATPSGTDSVRATPSADAAYVGSDGAAVSTYTGSATFSSGVPTGTAALLAPNSQNQVGNGIQIALPSSTTATPAWSAGATITVTLNEGVFTQGPSVSLGTKLVDLTSLNANAGFASGTNAHAATVVTGGKALGSATVTQSWGDAAHSVLVLKIAAADPGSAAADQGYVLSLSNVRITTPKLTATPPYTGVVSAAVTSDGTGAGGGSFVVGTTTLGFIAPATLAASAGATVSSSAKAQALPALTVTEGAVDSFAGGNVYTIAAPTGVTFDTSKAAVKAAGSTDIDSTEFTVTKGTGLSSIIVTLAAAATLDNAAIERFTVSGVTVAGVSGASLDLGLTAVDGLAADIIPVDADNAGSAGFSFAPDLTAVPLSIVTEAPSARIAGSDRYDTAADIAAEYADQYTGTLDAVVIANGETYKDGVDALAANYVAGQMHAPILLTQAGTLPATAKSALTSLFKGSTASITVYVMGKSDSVSDAVANEVKAAIEATVVPLPDVTVTRIGGDDRYETSADAASKPSSSLIGQYAFTNGASLQRTAILASGQVNADALAAGSVSAGAQIPVLLTTSGATLPTSVSDAIKSLGITQVIVLGDTDRVSATAVTSLADLGVTSVKRIAGSDRYETAADLYTFADSPNTADNGGLGLSYGEVAYLANGTAGFPDALAVGPLAGLGNSPILTTGVTTLAPSAKTFLGTFSANATKNPGTLKGVTALGATDRISADVLKAAQDALK